MYEQRFEFEDDKLYAYIPLPEYEWKICKEKLVITKEIFQECYKRWIEPQERSNKK